MECSTEGCIRRKFRDGLCAHHYEQKNYESLPKCTSGECRKVAVKRGFCEVHYRADLRLRQKQCSVSGCNRPVIANGFCGAHNKRFQRHGNLDPSRPEDWGGREAHPLYSLWGSLKKKRETVCDEWLKDFWGFVECVKEKPCPRHKLVKVDPAQKLGPENYQWVAPKYDKVHAESKAEYMRKWAAQHRDKNPEKYAEYEFRRRFGCDYKQYTDMLNAQDGCCAICGNPETAKNPVTQEPRRLAVDHCHTTGKIRGLLCSACNTAIGLMKDDVVVLQKAIEYLSAQS